MQAQPKSWLALKSVTEFVLNALTYCVWSDFSLHTEFYFCVLPSDWMGNVQMNSEETGVIKKHLISVGCVHSMTGLHKGKDYFCLISNEFATALQSVFSNNNTGVPCGMRGSPDLQEEQYCQIASLDIDGKFVC